MQRVAAVLNDRKGFHVDTLDEETRVDLILALVNAAIGVIDAAKVAPNTDATHSVDDVAR